VRLIFFWKKAILRISCAECRFIHSSGYRTTQEENVVFVLCIFFSTQKALYVSLSSSLRSLGRFTAAREYLHTEHLPLIEMKNKQQQSASAFNDNYFVYFSIESFLRQSEITTKRKRTGREAENEETRRRKRQKR
jgi:hypothetical protein